MARKTIKHDIYNVLDDDGNPVYEQASGENSPKKAVKRAKTLEKPILASVSTCPACGAAKRSHRACPKCGTYNGRKVVAVEA